MKCLCVIPARGGSKRIPRKNIKDFAGKPIISWSIEAALSAGCFEAVVVSTDDPEIAEVARQQGAEVPCERPASLADDHAGTTEVIAHAVDNSGLTLDDGDAACCIYPTAPLISPADLVRGLRTLRDGDWSFVFPVCAYDAPVQRSFTLGEHGAVCMLFPDQFQARSQDLPQVYFDAGQFYWGRVAAWREMRPIFAEHSTGLVIPSERVQDIDVPDDWLKAEAKFRALRMGAR